MEYKVELLKLIKEFSLETLYDNGNMDNISISTVDMNRPGLPLAGFYEHFDNKRIVIIGRSEMSFLDNTNPEYRKAALRELFALKPPVVIISRNLDIEEYFYDAAKEFGIPILRSQDLTSTFMANLVAYLNIQLAPRVTRHGVLVEVYGEGLLLLGESGVGKSETAIELIKRGHRLIADDAVEIRKVSNKTLVGSSPENIRHFLELRGIGIVNARRLFGIGAVKATEKIDLVIQMEPWDKTKVYDRMGLENENYQILDIDLPALTIPVKPGRNLAIIIEVAAMNNRQKRMGYNAAQELLVRLGMAPKNEDNIDDFDIV